ncbi:MAG: copper chaperone PCu(A)C [Bacteriovoracaceae bacterium]|nr:copper chaperone PCu(A)C [Bacteriovoracaceae bacterium]
MKTTLFTILLIMSLNTMANSSIEILTPIIRLPPPGQNVSAIFLKIMNKSKNDLSIIKVSGEFAKQFELHTMEMKDNMMRMRQVDLILLRKDTTTELKSGGLHIMVFDIKKPLQKDKFYDLKLFFSDNSEKLIKVKAVEFN